MKKINKLFIGVHIALFFSCSTDPVELPQGEFEKGVLILNEGAFGANDGEIYHYDQQTGNIKADIFETQNNRPFAGILQRVVEYGERTYLVANTGKVEVVNSADFRSLGAVSGGVLENCRDLTVAGDKLFISDWGAYDEAWANPHSFIAVVQGLEGGTVSNKIPVPSRPEGLIFTNNKILAACSAAGVIAVIDPEKEEIEAILEVHGVPFYFFEFANNVYLYARTNEAMYFHPISTQDFSVRETVQVNLEGAIYNGNFALGENGDIYVITTGVGDNKVAKVSLHSGEVLDEAFYSGSHFYGLGYHSKEGMLYIGEHNRWQGNGTVLKLNANGELATTLSVGRGPSGFIFR